MQVFTAVTGQNAKLLLLRDRGTIVVGKRADLLVLDADPLADIRNNAKGLCGVSRGAKYCRRTR
jgi:imidazolonepropionase-like amidohydrolase